MPSFSISRSNPRSPVVPMPPKLRHMMLVTLPAPPPSVPAHRVRAAEGPLLFQVVSATPDPTSWSLSYVVNTQDFMSMYNDPEHLLPAVPAREARTCGRRGKEVTTRRGDMVQGAASPLPELDALFAPQASGYLGADCAASIRLDEKRVLWLFGDTLVGELRDGQQAPRRTCRAPASRSSAWTSRPRFVDSFRWNETDGKPDSFWRLPEMRTDEWFWPLTGFMVERHACHPGRERDDRPGTVRGAAVPGAAELGGARGKPAG